MKSSVIESQVSFESRKAATPVTGNARAPESVTMNYLGEAVPVGIVGAATVAVFILILDTLAGHPLGTPNLLGAALLRGEIVSMAAPIQPGLVFGYTLLHIVTFVAVAAGAVSAEFTLSRAGVPVAAQLAAGAIAMMLVLTGILSILLNLVLPDGMGSLGFTRMLAVNAVAALTMAFTVHMQGEARRLERTGKSVS